MNIPTQSFDFHGVRFTVEQENGWSVPDCQLVCNKLYDSGVCDSADDKDRNRGVRFAEAIIQTVSAQPVDPATTVEGQLGFIWPTSDSSKELLAAAYTGFGLLKGLMTNFYTALREVEELTPGDKELKKVGEPSSDGSNVPPSESLSTTGSPGESAQPKS